MLHEMLQDTGLTFSVFLLDDRQQSSLGILRVDGCAEFH